jgi:ribosomal protein L37AE/L43A
VTTVDIAAAVFAGIMLALRIGVHFGMRWGYDMARNEERVVERIRRSGGKCPSCGNYKTPEPTRL